MEEEYEIKHTAFGDIKVRKSKPASHDDDEPITLDPCLTNQEPAAVEEEEEEHVMTPEEIEDNIRQAYEHYDAGDYAEAASLLEAIVFQECSDTPADVLSLLALMYWEGNGYEQSASDAFYFAARAHLGDNKLGTYVLACIFSERNNYKDMHIALQLCRQLNEYRKSQPLLMKLESMELPEDKKPHDDLSTNGHDGIWDLVLYAYSCAQTGDAEWALWCARRMRRKPFSRFADEDKLLSLFEIAAKELVDGKLECARIYAGRHEWGEAVERYDSAFEQCHNRESAAALTKAFDIGRGYQASEKNKRYYAYEWAKLDARHQEYIFSRHYPEEHQLYLEGLEAYEACETDRYNSLMVKASNGHHLLAHVHHSISQVWDAIQWADYIDKDSKVNPQVGEEIVNNKQFIQGHDHLKWLDEIKGIADWKGYMMLGVCEVMTYAFQERHDFKLAQHAFQMAHMPMCSQILEIACLMQEGSSDLLSQKFYLSLYVRWFHTFSEICYYLATSKIAETIFGLALHRFGQYLDDDLRQIPYEDYLMKYHEPTKQNYSTHDYFIQKIIMTSLLADDKVIRDYPPCCVEEEQGRLLRGGKMKSSKDSQQDIAYSIYFSFLTDIFNSDFEEDFKDAPAEMADCRLAGTLLGLTNFYAYAASEYHRLHLHSNTASRLASLSHYLMGFDPDHRYHHYTLF